MQGAVLTFNSAIQLITIQNIFQYTILHDECFIHMYILIHKVSYYMYTLVARSFTCGIVCLPLFLKVIEKGGIIRALQVAVGHHITVEHENILLLYHCIYSSIV